MAILAHLMPGELAVLTEVDEPDMMQMPGSTAKKPLCTPSPTGTEMVETPESLLSTSFSVFLQVGHEIKKVQLESGMTFVSLCMLFVDKFLYNPGFENFPTICIHDPLSGMQYGLEDIDEIKESIYCC